MNAPSDDDLITIADPRWGDYTPTHDPRLLANFKPRPRDVLITTAPKSGTTWMQQILHQLRMGGDTGFDSIDDEVPWLELPRQGITWQAQLDAYERIPNPRIFKTHCTFEQTPGTDVVRIIMSSRDPRDCCISYYHHVIDMTDEARKHIGIEHLHDFDDIFETWLEYGAWYRNIQSWWPHFYDCYQAVTHEPDIKNCRHTYAKRCWQLRSTPGTAEPYPGLPTDQKQCSQAFTGMRVLNIRVHLWIVDFISLARIR